MPKDDFERTLLRCVVATQGNPENQSANRPNRMGNVRVGSFRRLFDGYARRADELIPGSYGLVSVVSVPLSIRGHRDGADFSDHRKIT